MKYFQIYRGDPVASEEELGNVQLDESAVCTKSVPIFSFLMVDFLQFEVFMIRYL